jgi:hypothetical protein
MANPAPRAPLFSQDKKDRLHRVLGKMTISQDAKATSINHPAVTADDLRESLFARASSEISCQCGIAFSGSGLSWLHQTALRMRLSPGYLLPLNSKRRPFFLRQSWKIHSPRNSRERHPLSIREWLSIYEA